MKKTRLKRNSTLRQGNSKLNTSSPLKAKCTLKSKCGPKAKQKTAKVTGGEYWSVFSKDMAVCVLTGKKGPKTGPLSVVPHHVFGGPFKAASEKRGFVLPICSSLHTGTPKAVHENRAFACATFVACEEYYLAHYGTEEEFLKEFGRHYDESEADTDILKKLRAAIEAAGKDQDD